MAKPYSLLIQVPGNADIPEFYTTATPEDVATALHLGASLFHTVQSFKLRDVDATIADIEARNRAECAKITAVAEAEQQRLKQELATLSANRATLQQQYAEERTKTRSAHISTVEELNTTHATALEEQRQAIQRNTRATYEAQLARLTEEAESLQSRLKLLDESRAQDIRTAEQRTTAAMQYVLDEKQRAIERLERDRDRLTTTVDNNSAEIRALAAAIATKRAQSTKEKGTDFEHDFRDRLIAAYGTGQGFTLNETAASGIGHEGDIVMRWNSNTILWETKNYDKPVPTHEIDKFHRDMKENPTYSIGVMVSRITPITGKTPTGPKYIEFMNDRMLIYLSEFDRMAESTLQDLMMLFKMFWYASRNFESQETIEAAIRNIEKLHKEAAEAKTAWRVHKSRNDEMMRWISENLEGAEERLQYALRELQGMSTTAPLDIPPGLFRDCTGEAKSLEIIRYILEHTEVDPEESCILNDLAHTIGEKVHLSRDTMRTHIRSVLLDTTYIPQKGRQPARVQGLKLKNITV